MKTILLSATQNFENQGLVEEFIRNYVSETGRDLDFCDKDSPRGVEISTLYGVMVCPALLITTDDGLLIKMWASGVLPSIEEVIYFER
jgi:septum formation inhibitor-activating ATPase MinD